MILTGQLVTNLSSGESTLEQGCLKLNGHLIVDRGVGKCPHEVDFGNEETLISPGFVDAHVHLPQFDVIGAEGIVGGNREADGAVDRGKLFDGLNIIYVAEARAAVLWRKNNAQQTHRSQLFDHRQGFASRFSSREVYLSKILFKMLSTLSIT